MSIPDDRLQDILAAKDHAAALASCQQHGHTEGWAIVDGAIVIYDEQDPPAWLPPRDEHGFVGSSGDITSSTTVPGRRRVPATTR